jgi:hypothetical protein
MTWDLAALDIALFGAGYICRMIMEWGRDL